MDASSSLKRTFWTLFGRYKYLRLPFGINLVPEEFESNTPFTPKVKHG